ncbi:Vegetative incompatibility protein HET-E-1 [Trametes pubescens]|uniref:Vegetative incompatibility protein HET-E-1 n=1 Tax=Trametes pubescens TaxID=154538 RepID=A0A1M2V4A0_TRAPU|nr:Vegetative incompatibility protein HET-E-1 [Trametes pubescens]
MRLLNTTSGKFELVSDPQSARYAILSHTWDAVGEQSYTAIATLQSALFSPSDGGSPLSPHTNPSTPATESILFHPAISHKIREACRVARSHGFALLWMDACCIDKSSSAELIESLNSMYEWYRQANVCYVYLVDVPSTDDLGSPGSAFRASRWHRRGWTLQELIAPTNVVFLSSDWRPLGTKTTLAPLLESITGVDMSILLHKNPLSSVSVARRMWWASTRQTTRVEDEAYALMGIFDVRIPMVYGEGRKAFILLQEEILKTVPDQSLLAWGPRFSASQESASPASLLRLIEERITILDTPLTSFQRPARSLLALSPHDFRTAKTVTSLSTKRFQELVWDSSGQQGQLEQTSMYIPSMHGVRISFPLLRYSPPTFPESTLHAERSSYRDCGCGPFECTWLALLQCADSSGNLIALPLCEPPASTADEGLLVGTRKDVCLDCKRYYRTWALSLAGVHDMRADISITPVIIRRIPLDNTPSGAPPLRIRRVLIQPWCKSMLAAQGYSVSLRRMATSPHANDHFLSLRHKGCASASPSLIAHVEEIEVHIAQGERTDGVMYTIHYGSQLARHGSSRDLRADTAPYSTSFTSRRADSTRVAHFVPFTGLGEARHEFELRATGSVMALVQKLYLTLQNYTEPVWMFGGWGQAPYLDFSLNIELSSGTVAALGHERRSSTL